MPPQITPVDWHILRSARLNVVPVDFFIAIAHATHPARQLECLRIGGVYSFPGPFPCGTPVAENVILGPHTLALEGSGDLDTIFHTLNLEALQSLEIRCQRWCSFSIKELNSCIGRTRRTMTKLSIDHQYDNELDEGDLVALLANPTLQDLTELRLHFSNLSFGDKFYTKLTAGFGRKPVLPKLRVLDIGTCGVYTDGKLGRMLRSRRPGGYLHPLVDVKLAFSDEEVDHWGDDVYTLWVAKGEKGSEGYVKDSPVVQQLPFVHISCYEVTESDLEDSEDDDEISISSEVVRAENEASSVTVQLGDEQVELRGLYTQ
ncbi:uncharacterized protein SCHCODRAFT_02698293 [Schizophyllum commune H4-8]|uniref:uncharacterized protein n=1 Tax=Schizophyllum commune (strain H4-8 / FGSC 9210) TaxID=578458 RepID=UPI002160F0CC|nr:uncharacterized protein SCHCODRAFT_02698293 [Schizophyllum commune H4-8]KAI5896963.1 hypothetical protein SCHCODRAFT_02698293 [Schizophyllum commune H4-8]